MRFSLEYLFICRKCVTARKGSGSQLRKVFVTKRCSLVLIDKFNLCGGGPPAKSQSSSLQNWIIGVQITPNVPISTHFSLLANAKKTPYESGTEKYSTTAQHRSRKMRFHVLIHTHRVNTTSYCPFQCCFSDWISEHDFACSNRQKCLRFRFFETRRNRLNENSRIGFFYRK